MARATSCAPEPGNPAKPTSSPGGIIADKAYDTNALREMIEDAEIEVVIPSKRNRKIQILHDVQAYKLRNRIERFFNKLKHFRRIATRYDRRAIYCLAAVQLASSMMWMRGMSIRH